MFRDGSSLSIPSGVADDEFYAPVQLPSGAIVTGLTVWGSDTDASDDGYFSLDYSCRSGTASISGIAPSATVTNGFVGGSYEINSAASDLVVDNSDCG